MLTSGLPLAAQVWPCMEEEGDEGNAHGLSSAPSCYTLAGDAAEVLQIGQQTQSPQHAGDVPDGECFAHLPILT